MSGTPIDGAALGQLAQEAFLRAQAAERAKARTAAPEPEAGAPPDPVAVAPDLLAADPALQATLQKGQAELADLAREYALDDGDAAMSPAELANMLAFETGIRVAVPAVPGAGRTRADVDAIQAFAADVGAREDEDGRPGDGLPAHVVNLVRAAAQGDNKAAAELADIAAKPLKERVERVAEVLGARKAKGEDVAQLEAQLSDLERKLADSPGAYALARGTVTAAEFCAGYVAVNDVLDGFEVLADGDAPLTAKMQATFDMADAAAALFGNGADDVGLIGQVFGKQATEAVGGLLGRLAPCMNTAGLAITAAQITGVAADYALRELYLPTRDALTAAQNRDRHGGLDPNALLAGLEVGARRFERVGAIAADPAARQAPAFAGFHARAAAEAEALNRRVHENLPVSARGERDRKSDALRDEVQMRLSGVQVPVVGPDGTTSQAEAGGLYLALRRGEALTPEQHLALAPVLARTAQEVLAEDAIAGGTVPVGLPPAALTPDLAARMAAQDPLMLPRYLAAYSDEALATCPTDAKRALLTGVQGIASSAVLQVAGNESLNQAQARLIGAVARDLATQEPRVDAETQARAMGEMLAGASGLNRDNVIRHLVGGMSDQDLDALPADVKAAIDAAASGPGWVGGEDVAISTRLAESIRRDDRAANPNDPRGDARADAIEGRFPHRPGVVARERALAMRPADLDALPPAERERMAGLIGLDAMLEDGDVDAVTRLADSLRRTGHPEAAARAEAALIGPDTDDRARRRVEGSSPAALAATDPAVLEGYLRDMSPGFNANQGHNVTEDAEWTAIAKVTAALMAQGGEAGAAAAFAKVFDGVPAAGKPILAERLVAELDRQGQAARPPQDLVAALPEAVKGQIGRALARFGTDRWTPPTTATLEAASRVARSMAAGDPVRRELARAYGEGDMAAADVATLPPDELARVARQDGSALIAQIEDADRYDDAARNALCARVMGAALANGMRDPNLDPRVREARMLEAYRNMLGAMDANDANEVTGMVLDQLGPGEIAALPAAVREAMAATFYASEPSAARLAYARNEGVVGAEAGHAGVQAQDLASLATQFRTMHEASLARLVAENPERAEHYLERIRRELPSGPEKRDVLARLAASLRANDPRSPEARAATDARLQRLGL